MAWKKYVRLCKDFCAVFLKHHRFWWVVLTLILLDFLQGGSNYSVRVWQPELQYFLANFAF